MCETTYLTMSSRQIPKQVRQPTVGQVKAECRSPSMKVKANDKIKGSAYESKVTTGKMALRESLGFKRTKSPPTEMKSDPSSTSKETDKRTKHSNAKTASATVTTTRKLKSPQILKKTFDKTIKNVDNSFGTSKYSSISDTKLEAKPSASKHEDDITKSVKSGFSDSLKRIKEERSDSKSKAALPSSKQVLNALQRTQNIPSKVTTRQAKPNFRSDGNVSNKTNMRTIPIKRDTEAKAKDISDKIRKSPVVKQRDVKCPSRTSSRNSSKSPSPFSFTSGCDNRSVNDKRNAQLKCYRSQNVNKETKFSVNKQKEGNGHSQTKDIKERKVSLTNRTRSRSTTPSSVTSSRSESASSSAKSSDFKKQMSGDKLKDRMTNECKQAEENGSFRTNNINKCSAKQTSPPTTDSKKVLPSNSINSVGAKSQAQRKTTVPSIKQKRTAISSKGTSSESEQANTDKVTSQLTNQANNISVSNVTELKREKGCSKTVANSPKTRQRITQAAMTVTDRLSKLPKSKTRASGNNKDSSSQLMSKTGKQKQSYIIVKQKRTKPVLSESSETSSRQSEKVCSSIIPNNNTPVENHKLLIKSNTDVINKSNKYNIKRNYSATQQENINHDTVSETKKYTRNLHQNNNLEGDGCLHMHSTIDEDHTCTSCHKQEQNACACRLQSGVKTSHLSEELSNSGDLGCALLTKKDCSSEQEIISDVFLDGQSRTQNSLVNSAENSDNSCLPCDSNLNSTDCQQLDYCDTCDSSICKHTCNAREINDQNNDTVCQNIIENDKVDILDTRDIQSGYDPFSNVINYSNDVTNIKDEISSRLMERQSAQVHRGTKGPGQKQSHYENSLENSLTQEGQEELHVSMSNLYPDEDSGHSESNSGDSACPLTRKHKQITKEPDSNYSLLNKHSPGETVSITSKMISENELMHSGAFTFKSTSGQQCKISILSDTKCISCKYFLDKCTCTPEKSENKVYLSNSDMNLAHNRHTGILSSGNLCFNVCTRKSKCKINYFSRNLKMDGILPGVGILAHLTSCKCNKMQDKLENVVCGNNFDIKNTKLPPQKTKFCSSGDITCGIKASREDGGSKWNKQTRAIHQKDTGLLKHTPLSDLDEITPSFDVQDKTDSALDAEPKHLNRNYSIEDVFEAANECSLHFVGQCNMESILPSDHELQENCVLETNLVETQFGNACETPSAGSFVNVTSLKMDNNTELISAKQDRKRATDELTTTETIECCISAAGDLIDICSVLNSLERSVEPINAGINEFYLSMSNECCTEIDLPSPEGAVVTECPESCETQVSCNETGTGLAVSNDSCADNDKPHLDKQNNDGTSLLGVVSTYIACDTSVDSQTDTVLRRSVSLPFLRLNTNKRRYSSGNVGSNPASHNSDFSSIRIQKSFDVSISAGICANSTKSRRVCSLKDLCRKHVKERQILIVSDTTVPNVAESLPNEMDVVLSENQDSGFATESNPCISFDNTCVLAEKKKIKSQSDNLHSENKELLPVAKQMSNTESDVCFHTRSETAKIMGNSCNQEDHFPSNYSSTDITGLPELVDCYSGNYSRVGSIGEESEENRHSSVQVLNHEQLDVGKVANENDSLITPDEFVTDDGQASETTHCSEASPGEDAAASNVLTINNRNRESGYFSNDQSQDDTLTCLNENAPQRHDICASTKTVQSGALEVAQAISCYDKASTSCRDSCDLSFPGDSMPSFQKAPIVSSFNDKNDDTAKCCSTADLQSQNETPATCHDEEYILQKRMSCSDSTDLDQPTNCAANIKNRDIRNEIISEKIEKCDYCSRLSNKNETSKPSVSSYNEANDTNQISTLESQRVTSENLSEASLHHDQTVCGQSNQIKVDKNYENLKETSNFSDKHYGLSCMHGVNLCQKCFKNLHISEKFNSNGQNIKVDDQLNLSGCFCIEPEYCDYVFEICSENVLQEQITCSEDSPKTSNVCYKSVNCIYDNSKDNTDDPSREDLISSENFETKQDTLYSKQNDKEYSQNDFYLKNNAISISNGENRESFCDSIRILPGSYSSVSDCKNVENHLAKSKYTDSSHAFRNKRSYSDSEIYAHCFRIPENKQGIYAHESSESIFLHGRQPGLIYTDKCVYPDYTERCERCDNSNDQSECQDFVSSLQDSSSTCICEYKDVCNDLFASANDNECDSDSNILNATDVLINSSEQVGLSDISPYCSFHQPPGVKQATNSVKYRSEAGVNCSIKCQICSNTCCANLLSNEQAFTHETVGDNKEKYEANVLAIEAACKRTFCQNYKSRAPDPIIERGFGNATLIICERDESIPGFISHEKLCVHKSPDTFVDADDNFDESDLDEINDLNDATSKRFSLLYTGSEQSTSVDSFQDAVEYFDREYDFNENRCENSVNIEHSDRSNYAGICGKCQGAILTYHSLQTFDTHDAYSKQHLRTESTISRSYSTDYFENFENTCYTDNPYLESVISSNIDDSTEKCIHKSRSLDSLYDSNLNIYKNILGSINLFEDSSNQKDKSCDIRAIPSFEYATCKNVCTCWDNFESEVIRDVQPNMSQPNESCSNDIGRDRPRVRVATRNNGNCARSRYEELMKERNQSTTQSSPKSTRVRRSNNVLNSVNILESKVTLQSTTSNVDERIENAVTIRNKWRRLRELSKNASLGSSSEKEGTTRSSDQCLVVQSETEQHASKVKDVNREKEDVKTESSRPQSGKMNKTLNSTVDNNTKVDFKLNVDTSDSDFVINKNVIATSDGPDSTHTRPKASANLDTGQFVKVDSVKRETSHQTNRNTSDKSSPKSVDIHDQSLSISGQKASKTNTLQIVSKDCKNDIQLKSEISKKELSPVISPSDRKQKYINAAQKTNIADDSRIKFSMQVATNRYVGKCDSLLSNNSTLVQNTKQCDRYYNQKVSENVPQVPEKETRLVSTEVDDGNCKPTNNSDMEQKEINKVNNSTVLSHLTVTVQISEDVCQIVQGTDIREVSVSAQEDTPLTFATAATVVPSQDSNPVQAVETIDINSEMCTCDTLEMSPEACPEGTTESISPLPQSASKIENIHNVDSSLRMCDKLDTNALSKDIQEDIGDSSASENLLEPRAHETSSDTLNEALSARTVTYSTLSDTCASSLTESLVLPITVTSEQLNTNLETISTSNYLNLSNSGSNESYLSVHNVDSSTKSAKMQENKDVIYSDSENTSLILSQDHDAVLCVQAYSVFGDKAGESLQLIENRFSNSDKRLSNEFHKEANYDLELHDLSNESEVSIYDDGGRKNADSNQNSISISEGSQSGGNSETVSTQNAPVVSLQEPRNDSEGILCTESDSDISFEVSIVDCNIDNEHTSDDQPVLEQADSLIDNSLFVDLSPISSIENGNQESISVLETRTRTDSDLDYGLNLAINTVVDTNNDNSGNYCGGYDENKGRSDSCEVKEYNQLCKQKSLDYINVISNDEVSQAAIPAKSDCDVKDIGTTSESVQIEDQKVGNHLSSSIDTDISLSFHETESIACTKENIENGPEQIQTVNMREITCVNDLRPVISEPAEHEICEDSNISVALALRREKEKLNEVNEQTPVTKTANRNFRRATAAIISQNRERKLLNQTKTQNGNLDSIVEQSAIQKSKCLHEVSVSEPNSIRLETNSVNNKNETDDVIVSKKVSDICRTFNENAQTCKIEIEQGPKLSPAISPQPQRRHKSWVCKEGKWKRESYHEPVDNCFDNEASKVVISESQDLKSVIKDDQSVSYKELVKLQCFNGENQIKQTFSEDGNHNGFYIETISENIFNKTEIINEVSECQHTGQNKQSFNEQVTENINKTNENTSNQSKSNELISEIIPDSTEQSNENSIENEKNEDILSLIMGEGIEYMDGVDHMSSDSSESWYSTSSGDYEEPLNLDNKDSITSICTKTSLKEDNLNLEASLIHATRPNSLVSLCKDALLCTKREHEFETEMCAELKYGPVIVLPIPTSEPNEIQDKTCRTNDFSSTVDGIAQQDLSIHVNGTQTDAFKPTENISNKGYGVTDGGANEIMKMKAKKKPMVPLPSKLPCARNIPGKDTASTKKNSDETSCNKSIGNEERPVEMESPSSMDSCIPKQIPKLKAVKIKEEEIYEGKPEYTKECNLHPLGIDLDTMESSVKLQSDEKQMASDSAIVSVEDGPMPKKLFDDREQISMDSTNAHTEDKQRPTELGNAHLGSGQMSTDFTLNALKKKRIPTSMATHGKHMVKSQTFSAFQEIRSESDLKIQTLKRYSKIANATAMYSQSSCKIPMPKSFTQSTTKLNAKTDLLNDQKGNIANVNDISDNMIHANTPKREQVNKLTRTISLPETSLVYGKIPIKTNTPKKTTDEIRKVVKEKRVDNTAGDLERGGIRTITKAYSVGDENKDANRCERSQSLQHNKAQWTHKEQVADFINVLQSLRNRLNIPQLLSEIAEVEESHDDKVSPRTNKGPNSACHDESSLEPRVKRPVTRSNKRRSLSLPTGTLAFGEARIVYKNGHFTIETMDGTELDSSQLTNQQAIYISNQDQTSNQKPSYNRPYRTPAKMLPEPHSDLQREIITERPHLRRQVGKTVLTRNELIDKGDELKSNLENVSPNQNHYNQQNLPLPSMCSKENVDSSFKSLNRSEQSLNQSSESLSYSEQMELDDDVSRGNRPVRYHSSSSLLDTDKEEIKRVAQRARRTSSFRQAQEQGSCRLSGILEDKDHVISNRRTTSLDESQNSDSNQSRLSQSPNQNTNFFQRMMAKRKSSMENFNLSSFAKQSESAKDFFSKKMTLKGLFRKNRSDSPANSPLRTQLSSSPPVSVFIEKDDNDPKMASEPNTPYKSKDMRRRHTSADLFANAFKNATPSSSNPNSNCNTPTRDREAFFRTNSTPGMEASFIVRTDKLTPSRTPSSTSMAKSITPTPDEDQLSIKSTSSATSSVHSAQSPPMEQPNKPKTPKPVGTSPRRIPSGSSQSSQSSRIFSFRNGDRSRTMSATSLESENSEIVFEDYSELMCECENLTPTMARVSRASKSPKSPSSSSSSVFPVKCEICGKYTAELFRDPHRLKKFTIGPDNSEDHERVRKDSAGRLALLVQSEISASNSNDSGIQHDVSVHSSNESLKGTPESKVRLRRQKSSSPRPERPKSEIGVRWADLDTQEYEITTTPVRRRDRSQNIKDRPRPKSDFDDNIQLFDELFLEVLEDFETDGSSMFADRMKAFGSEINLQPYCSLRNLYEMRRRDWENSQAKNRRMSTPHPIKSRLQRTPKRLQKQAPLVRSSSMPESLDKVHKRRKLHHLLDFHEASLSKHLDADEYLSDDSDLSFDHISLQEKSLSVQSSQSQLTSMDEEEDNLTYAEALWDHITMDPEELGFRAGDLINVFDMSDKDWWFGEIEDREGWFPAAFVRLRVNQDQFEEELEVTLQPELSASPKLRRISTINKVQARTNVVNEIISAEREYVKHLKDVVEGYIQHARKRHEMFPEERLSLIFGNIESIYAFSQKFLSQLEMCIDVCPHLSEVGQCFLDNEKGFEIYSDYCNNHPSACEELKELYRNAKYRHFFEACRLLQELVEIPLEGFLLTPVQKICKYPLQLAELLKYTPPEHADYLKVKAALLEMRKIATLINERKRKMESIEKIAAWQHTVADWEGEDLLERSSELIFSGDINKINSAGWSQERYFFLFDHQLIYCKKEILKRHVFSYKGRIDLDHCDIIPLSDGKDTQYNVTVKHGWKLHETHKDKWYLLYTKTETGKDRWLKALADERKRVREDQENDFCVPEHWKQTVLNKVRSQSSLKEKHHTHRPTPDSHIMLQKDFSSSVPYATLPRIRRSSSQKPEKKKGWFNFGGKKSKR